MRKAKKQHWNAWRWKTSLPLLLSCVFFAAQLITLSHNAEFGHDHHHHDDDQVCELVLYADRSGSADAPSVFTFSLPVVPRAHHGWTQQTSLSLARISQADARAPPVHS